MRVHPAHLPVLVLSSLLMPAAHGESWLDAAKNAAASHAVGVADQAVDAGIGAAVTCVVTDQACIDDAQKSGKEVVVTNKKGKPLPADKQPKAAASSGASGGASGAATAKPAAGGQAGSQPNLTAVKSDFVPGEKTVFFDDFSDMPGDAPPPHWKVRDGMTELRTGGNVRQLTLTNSDVVLSPNLKGLPRNFTMESTLKFENLGTQQKVLWYYKDKEGYEVLRIDTLLQYNGDYIVELHSGDPRQSQERIGKGQAKIDEKQPAELNLWVQDGRVRVYVNGARLIDVNQTEATPIASVEFAIGLDDTPNAAIGLRRVRFAESAPDMSKTIMSAGRYVTHGILFDTDSDRIKPESAPVIKKVAETLQANSSLKLLIEGYTDSSGDATHNMDLSKRRADAVKAVLVSQFGIDESRLTTNGLGASKPIASNDTPQGRAENRRVEFVKQ
jgi:outer membrane protein OmpA-like peptidoglycan-associated protein